MADPRILIYGTCFIRSAEARELLKLWSQCVDTLNPDCDVVMIDAPSPYGAEKVFDKWAWETESGGWKRDRAGVAKPTREGFPDLRWVFSFDQNAGHLNETGVDGAGRAFMQGMVLAQKLSYDYCVHVEGDLLMTRPIRPWVEKMHRHGIKCAAPFDSYYQFGEWGLSFFNVDWLRETKFVERYDWRSQTGLPIPEVVFEKLAGDDFFTLPIRGVRNDFHQVNRNNVVSGFPYGLDYITHCYKDFETYRALMKRNGVSLP
jgi:hypothetical protein